MKYLTLIRSIALLHQQRPVQSATHRGKTIEYIEVTLDDVAVANRLVEEVLGRSLEEPPPQTRRLLLLIDGAVAAECARLEVDRADFRFSRKDVRARSESGYTVLKKHLARLEEMEYLLVHRGGRGQRFVYELVFERGENASQPRTPRLIDVYDLEKSPLEEEQARGGRPLVAGLARGGRVSETRVFIGPNGSFVESERERTLAGAYHLSDLVGTYVMLRALASAGPAICSGIRWPL